MVSKVTQLLLPVFLLTAKFSLAQNIGIGVTSPQQKLEVNGAVKIGSNDAVAPTKGTMRWNDIKNDFEGYNGFKWVSLSNGKTGIGDETAYVHENNGIDPMLSTSTQANYNGFGQKIIKGGQWFITAAPEYNSTFSRDQHTFNKVGVIFRWYKLGNNFYSYKTFSSYPAEEAKFGFDISSDEERVIITEPGATIGNNEKQGRAYVYSNTSFASSSSLIASDGQANDGFGHAAAISGNYAVVTAPMKMLGTARTGRAYIFKLNGSTWTSGQSLAGAADADEFGAAVAMSGDWLAISAKKAAHNSSPDHGKVQMYKLNTATGNWSTHSTVLPADFGPHNSFGSRITIKGDTMMITESADLVGAIPRYYMYILKNNVWEHVHEFNIPNPKTENGMSQADFLGDKVVIGEANASFGAASRNGRTHVFEWKNNSWRHTSILTARQPQNSQFFGRGVLIDTDIIYCAATGAHGYYNFSGMVFSFNLP